MKLTDCQTRPLNIDRIYANYNKMSAAKCGLFL